MTRRDLLRLLLASAMAEAVDVEQLLWVPNRSIVTVPSMLVLGLLRRGEMHIQVNFDTTTLGDLIR